MEILKKRVEKLDSVIDFLLKLFLYSFLGVIFHSIGKEYYLFFILFILLAVIFIIAIRTSYSSSIKKVEEKMKEK